MATSHNSLINSIRHVLLVAVLFLISVSCQSPKVQEVGQGQLKMAGSMHRAMQQGDLSPTISLDTITNKEHLYGVGPLDSLRGEIMVVDGNSYASRLSPTFGLTVTETFDVKAPFLVYANVSTWDELQIPDSVTNDKELETFITTLGVARTGPLVFKFGINVDTGKIHVVGSPRIGSKEHTHPGQWNSMITKEHVNIVRFFSTKHQGVFTHHDSFVHMHLITGDKKVMGHVDYLKFSPNSIKLFFSNIE